MAIDERVQTRYLSSALENNEQECDLNAHQKEYDKYCKQNGCLRKIRSVEWAQHKAVPGFCIMCNRAPDVRNGIIPLVKSYPVGKDVCYNCTNCLSRQMVEARWDHFNGSIYVRFNGDPGAPGAPGSLDFDRFPKDNRSLKKLRIIFTGPSTATFPDLNVLKNVPYAMSLSNTSEPGFSPWILDVQIPVKYGSHFLEGLFPMRIQGNYACTNHITGRGCMSMKAWKEDRWVTDGNLMSQTVPAGYVGWKEQKTNAQRGTVRLYNYCLLCSQSRDLTEISPNSDPMDDMSREELVAKLQKTTQELEELQSKHEDLMDRYAQMKKQYDRSRAAIARLNAEFMPIS